MYSQPHGSLPSHFQGSPPGQGEYHSSMRGDYPPPESYYRIPPNLAPSMHQYYDFPPYLPYHHGTMGPPMLPPTHHYRPGGTPPINTPPLGEGDKLKNSKNIPSSNTHKPKFIHKDRFDAFETTPVEEDKRQYNLVVCQQPLRARMCGFGEKDRRPVDPPPIVQLVVLDEKGQPDAGYLFDYDDMLQNPFFVLHVTLWSEDRRHERNVISNPPKTTRVLMGSLVSSPALLKNTEGEQGCYFCFPDLSIRTEGTYTLKFSLLKLGIDDRLITTKSNVISTAFSDQFTVFSAKKFPGMTESTELSKAFAKQGLKIPIRNDVRPRKNAEE
ncbi:7741_t:CDS:2 [Ambispora leptoticha]|uniref:7741_t:CDS:1 n=1 Tax=Ambispora leptoticha TaxID=144679 RepID=A0A9N8ZDI0_9GLOM|nr:7741_t:CDS:2 [Ambispora leptoticha]